MFLSLLYLIYIHHFPRYSERATLIVETFNEFIFLCVCYHIVLFSNLIWAPEVKKQTGTSLLGFVFTLLLVNTIVIIVVSIMNIKRKTKLGVLENRQKEFVRQRNTAIGVIQDAQVLNKELNEEIDLP